MSLSFVREGFFLTGRVVLSADDIRRAIRRIAHEIVERNHGAGNITLVGLRTRGVPLAERLAAAIEEFEGERPPIGALDIGLYRDDLSSTELRARIQPTDMPGGVDGRHVVLVDDVLFTGRSIRAALDALTDFGRPAEIQLAVLVDRGHRQLPIRADYVGKNIPTSLQEEVDVLLEEMDGEDEVRIVQLEGER
jgi:pyrimidine operon attenuation protein/uracil phosphoribosyltransferase